MDLFAVCGIHFLTFAARSSSIMTYIRWLPIHIEYIEVNN